MVVPGAGVYPSRGRAELTSGQRPRGQQRALDCAEERDAGSCCSCCTSSPNTRGNLICWSDIRRRIMGNYSLCLSSPTARYIYCPYRLETQALKVRPRAAAPRWQCGVCGAWRHIWRWGMSWEIVTLHYTAQHQHRVTPADGIAVITNMLPLCASRCRIVDTPAHCRGLGRPLTKPPPPPTNNLFKQIKPVKI